MKIKWPELSKDDLDGGEFDGDPATGFMFGLKFWLPNGQGFVECSNIFYDEENRVPYMVWNPQLLKELMRRTNKCGG